IFVAGRWLLLPRLTPDVTPGAMFRFYISSDSSDVPNTDPPHILRLRRQIARSLSPDYILTTMLTAMAIGMLCARSLHYQFYAYIAWGTPFLLWKAELHPVLIYAIWGLQEWAWNVYPSTDESSMVVVA